MTQPEETLYRKVGDQYVPVPPRRPATTRPGRNHEMRIGDVTAVFVVNRDDNGEVLELFGKADGGMQGHLDMVCTMLSLGWQGRLDPETVARHLRHDRTHPQGGPGQPTSIYDGLGRVIEEEFGLARETLARGH